MQFVHTSRPDGKVGLKIELGDIVIPQLEGKESLLSFPLRTYTKICKVSADADPDDDMSSFSAINNFFDWISIDDRRIIVIYLATMHCMIKEEIGTGNIDKIVQLSRELGKMVIDLNDTISLYDKLVMFSDKHIPINEFKGAGGRPQDTPITTYLYDDIVKLMACVLLSKMLAPIFGTLMYYSTKYNVESRLKEMHCLPVIQPLLQHVCPDVVYKLKKYIEPIVKKEFKEDINSINIGLTKNSIENHVFVNLIIRNFINIDIYRENSNHITAIRVGIKKAIDTQHSMMKNHKVMIRQDVSSVPDDQRRSQLEIDSVVSDTTFDIPIIAEAFINRTITSFLREYEIPKELYDACYEYNLKSQVSYNILNKLVIEMLFSGPLSGTNSLKYLKAITMIKLITTAQLICMASGYYELGHGLTASLSVVSKTSMSDIDHLILINYQNKQQYRNYVEKLLTSSLGNDCLISFFNNRTRDIVNAITANTYVFNTPPILWEHYNVENLNCKAIQFSENYMQELCTLLNIIWIGNC